MTYSTHKSKNMCFNSINSLMGNEIKEAISFGSQVIKFTLAHQGESRLVAFLRLAQLTR